jgi:hypothetical protein
MSPITQMTNSLRTRRHLRILFAVLLSGCSGGDKSVTTPERSLGEPTGRFNQPFTRISGVRELADGRLIVADQSEKTVFLIDSGLTAARPLARQGQGPLEYAFPAAVLPFPGDSTLISDLIQRRLLVLDPAGEPVRTINLPPSLGFGTELKGDGQGNMYTRANALPDPAQMSSGPPDSAALLRWNLVSGRIDTVATVGLPQAESGASGGNFFMMVHPMTPADDWAVTPSGWIGLARHTPFSVDWIGADGGQTRGATIPYEPVAVVEADKEEYQRAQQERGSMRMTMQEGGGAVSISEGPAPSGPPPGMPERKWPTHKPPFLEQSVLAGPGQQLWILRTQPAGQALAGYDVVDSTGKVMERVTVPVNSRIMGFGVSTVYVVRTDEDGLQWLERYRAPKD